ncbi:acyl-CoA dehydrogenase family protein [Mycolicibacterium wolinskyi]|uniref:acyl-CoA dehydrogenase family protein n=1 Tax=Mycolicibacterium wolinskyi TaxID=59750 RepID=UPI001F24F18C|nr:acyl-CoA dehydrogenase family protein [Mycolicibacterium wolinskyi]
MTSTTERAKTEPDSQQPLGGSVTDRLGRVPAILDDLRDGDAAAERDRVLQYEAVGRLRAAGLLNLRVPARYGGPGGSVRDVLAVVIEIARASSNVAQALRAHFGYSERLLSNRATEAERLRWFARINEGLVFGNAITDGTGSAPSSADTTVLADADGVLRLNGYKFYSNGLAVRRCHRGVGRRCRRPGYAGCRTHRSPRRRVVRRLGRVRATDDRERRNPLQRRAGAS